MGDHGWITLPALGWISLGAPGGSPTAPRDTSGGGAERSDSWGIPTVTYPADKGGRVNEALAEHVEAADAVAAEVITPKVRRFLDLVDAHALRTDLLSHVIYDLLKAGLLLALGSKLVCNEGEPVQIELHFHPPPSPGEVLQPAP